MAAPRKTSQEADSDSSSGAEDLERFREAAWEPPGVALSQFHARDPQQKVLEGSVKKTVQCPENSAPPLVPSLRVRPDNHEHDGNELQTTPEFRTHVAKKLAAMLDSCIKEIPGSKSYNQKSAASESEDEGFRLLTTSVPGDPGKIIPSPTLKRRVASSTSEDSEEEKQRRFREAAVSGLDILSHSALQTTPMDVGSNNQPKKKKKKKKAKKERRLSDEGETVDQNVKPEGKRDGFKKKKERVSDKTESNDQTVHLETAKSSQTNKRQSDCHNGTETVKDGSQKKLGLCETASDPNISPMCGKSGTKKKKKVVVDNCHGHD